MEIPTTMMQNTTYAGYLTENLMICTSLAYSLFNKNMALCRRAIIRRKIGRSEKMIAQD